VRTSLAQRYLREIPGGILACDRKLARGRQVRNLGYAMVDPAVVEITECVASMSLWPRGECSPRLHQRGRTGRVGDRKGLASGCARRGGACGVRISAAVARGAITVRGAFVRGRGHEPELRQRRTAASR
jgi:hypothetical protein